MALRDGKDKLSPTFAGVFQNRLRELGLNPRTFAKSIPTPYDPVRKIYNGEVFPGDESPGRPGLLPVICNTLGLDIEEMRILIEIDRDASNGKISIEAVEALDKDPELAQLGRHFKLLSEKDKREVISLIKSKAHSSGSAS